MTSAYKAAILSRKQTPQTESIPGRETEMVKNNAGGYVFSIDPMDQFKRFLILGSTGGTYYVSERAFTQENTQNILDLFNSSHGKEAIKLLVAVSTEGRAPKVSPTLYALALAMTANSQDVRRVAAKAISKVVSTNSQMLEFVSYANELRGWGRLMRESVAAWYNNKPVRPLCYQVAKYRNRSKWTTRDVLRMAKPVPKTEERSAVYSWVVGKSNKGFVLPYITAMETIKDMELNTQQSISWAANYIVDNSLTHEMIPNTWLKHPEIWESLLMSMNPTAMIRNLNKMTACGLIKPLSGVANFIATKLTDEETLKTARIHPFNVLVAQTTYKSGKGFRGDLVWTPVPQIISALEDAFYKSFKFIESANKRTLIGIDVSSSMCGSQIANTNVSAHVGATAMAMATVRREPQTHIFGFAHDFRELGISVNDSLQDAMRKTQSSAFGRTDCSLPMQYALTNKLNVDTFVVYTDNETYAGRMAPCQALALYRKESGIPAKLIVVGMTATRFTIADPKDSGMLDVVGFDSAAPSIIADFSAERF